jgi:hypothetical protein
MAETLWELPVPSSGRYGVEFRQLMRRRCVLLFSYEDEEDGKTLMLELLFDGVEAFKCTYHHACTLDMRAAYDKLVDVGDTEWLGGVRGQLAKHGDSPGGLSHMMIYFDDGPCYEFICRSFRAEQSAGSGDAGGLGAGG